jgi:uncharacterized protein involved in exopolysaccharide biosynthesis
MLKIKELYWEFRRYWYLFLILPAFLAGCVIFLTRNTEKIYDSNTIIYTGISTRKSADLTESVKIDYFISNNLMDNIVGLINSRKTAEMVSLELLAQHLALKPGDPKYFSEETYNELKGHIPNELWNELAVVGNINQTHANIIKAFVNEDDKYSPIRYVVDKHKYYGVVNIIDRTRVVRQKSSDMVEISYYADDPGIVYQTLRIIVQVYLKRYSDLRTSENSGSIDFYISEKERIFQKLQESENRLKVFVTDNRIMNFYEQGKNLDNYINDIEKELTKADQIAQGANASLKVLEEKLSKNKVRSSLIDSLGTYRELVAEKRLKLNTLIAESPQKSNSVIALKGEIREINDILSAKINNLYLQDFSVEGIPASIILGEWLNAYLQKEKELSAFEVSLRSMEKISGRIDAFAPLGAELKRLEREVQINEDEYLYILSGLNQARLQNQNLKISQTQEVIDPPFFPNVARGSKRKIIVLASFMFGYVLLIGIFSGKLLLNDDLKEPENAEKITGLKVIAAFPNLPETGKTEYYKTSVNIFLNEISKIIASKNAKKQINIAIHPIVDDEQFQEILADTILLLPSFFSPVRLYSYKPSLKNYIAYDISNYKNGSDIKEFVESDTDDPSNYLNIVFMPPSREHAQNAMIIKEFDWNIFSCRADYSWKVADTNMTTWVREIAGKNGDLILTSVDINFIKDMNKKG